MCTVGSSDSLRLLSSSQQNPGWGVSMLGDKNGCGGVDQIINLGHMELINVFVQEYGKEGNLGELMLSNIKDKFIGELVD